MDYYCGMRMLVILMLLCSFMQDREAVFTETASGRQFNVSFTNQDSLFDIVVEGGNMIFSEHYVLRADTLLLLNRDIKLMSLGRRFTYEPPRPRMLLPMKEAEFNYTGRETSFAYKADIETYTSITKHDSIFNVLTVTTRNDKPDTSGMTVTESYRILKITLDIPAFMGIYKLFGFKSPYLEFIRNEQSE